LVAAGVQRVVAPLEDSNPDVSGKGFERLRSAGIEVEIAEEFREEAAMLNEAYLHFMRSGRPLVTLKTAATLDGKIAAPDDNTGWITSGEARQHVHEVRHSHDAILTGIGTVLEDDPLMTDRSGFTRRKPLMRIVVDSLCRLPIESQLVQSFDNDLAVMTTSAAVPKRKQLLEERGIPVQVMDAPMGRVDLKAVIRWAAQQQLLSLMVEAGAKLNWAALEVGIVDKVLIYYAPKILGGLDSLPMAGGIGRRSRSGAIRLHGLKTFMVGKDEFAVEAYL
jgi:diaminohydroxyphosphoribosylaminopyrimidine deaminase/5-amino-6-(5-phosphoribosylamino)uracil reductase